MSDRSVPSVRSRPARRRLGPLLVALAVATALSAACGGIPTSGPVHAGARLDGPSPLRDLAVPPVLGASAADIVHGFLRAEPGLDGDLAVARSYLTGSAARTWLPTFPQSPVVVYPDESSLHIVAGPDGTFTVSTPIEATVDVNGVYTAAAAGAKSTLKLKVDKVGSQWRISSIDQAQSLWLAGYDLDGFYDQVALYYVAPGTRQLVPDLRWFPATPGLATVVARAQLEPPPAYLRSAVSTGIPAATRLAVDSVPSNGSVATVDLNSFARQPSQADRVMLYAQLAAAVTQAPGVEAVKVLVDGKVLDLPGQSLGSGTTAEALGFSTSVSLSAGPITLALKGTRSVLDPLAGLDDTTTSFPAGALPTPAVRLRSLARSTDAREFAGVVEGGRALVRIIDGATATVLSNAPDLTRPSYDLDRWLWTVSSGDGADTRVHVLLTGPGVESKDVTVTTPAAPWLAGRQVTALRISRDGARALVTSVRRGAWRIDIAGVQRDAHGRPLSLGAPLRVGSGLSDVADAAWVTPGEVAVLGRSATDARSQPYLVTIGGEVIELPLVADAVGIAAGDNESAVAVITAKGEVLDRGGSTGWVPLAKGIDVAFPG
jgi:hypothetical protein